ncbi:MAG: hypothetical protein DID92_2727743361 [Candidatus Nitrotoga sp. SPKER]|nr:MAG: hypothetical protein DID92_2727743361 [Candidatus Nitrotoga sp. SPKER]
MCPLKGFSQKISDWGRRQAHNMHYSTGLILFVFGLGSASALTPPLDNFPSFFAGEWAGTGEKGSYCYLNLGVDGWGLVLIDGGVGDWLGARMQWRNLHQTLQVEKVVPLAISIQQRIMPLKTFLLRSEFNQSLSLTWNAEASGCQLQKIETTAHQLNRARNTIEGLLDKKDKR